ncbi:MAG: hypothetical protein R3C49_06390 [Planctomycetaceae bacterium]
MISAVVESGATPPERLLDVIDALATELPQNRRQDLERLFPFVRKVLDRPLPVLTQSIANDQTMACWTTLISRNVNIYQSLDARVKLARVCEQFPSENSSAALGAAFYRSGKLPEAISTLQKVTSTSTQTPQQSKPSRFLP